MENTSKTTAKDFFLHLGAMVALYWSVGVLLNLLYAIINSAFPQTTYYYGSASSISFPVASLIVVFPVYLLLVWLNQKSYSLDSLKKEIWVRRWGSYITLFLAGCILVGSLVSVVYLFLDGQELTTAFLLKSLSWFVVGGLVFGYYIQDIREKIDGPKRKIWLIVAVLVVLVSIILGFLVTGSPRSRTLMRYDEQKVSDLQNIQNQVVSYWQSKKALPESLNDLRDPISNFYIPTDPQSQGEYVYRKTGTMSFELCADFNLASDPQDKSRASNAMYYPEMVNENWTHGKGQGCFQRTIDPDRYPPFAKPVL